MNVEPVDLATLTVTPGWKHYNAAMLQKLEKSLVVFGQLRPLVLRGTVVVDGRNLLQAMKNLKWTVGFAVQAPEAGNVDLALEIAFDIDYAALAAHIAKLDLPSTELATLSRFSAARLDYFKVLTDFDWGQFQMETEQQGLWEEESSPHATSNKAVATVGIMPEAPKPEPRTKTVRIKPAAAPPPPPPPPRPAPPPPPPPPPRPAPLAAPQGPRPSPARVTAPFWVEPDPGPPVPAGDVLVRFSGEPSPEERDWRPSEPPELHGVTEIELDTETTGLKWYAGDRPIGISIRTPDGQRWYLPWGHAGGNLDEAVVKRWAQRELRGKTITGANTKFDVHMLREWGVDLEAQDNRVSDVMHYAALLDDYRREFSLDVLARDFLGKGKSGQGLDKSRMADYHASAVAGYAMDDVTLTGELRTAMWPELDKQQLQKVRALEEDLIYPVCEMERNGAPIDREMLKRWVERSEQEYYGLLKDISEEVGFQVNPDKSEDMTRLFEKLKLPIHHFTDKGTPSFTDAVLKHIQHPVVVKARRATKLGSLRSKFLVSYDNVVGEDALLRFELHQLRGDEHGTNRGRFSSSNKNIQQVMSIGKQRMAWGYDENDDTHDEEIYLVRNLFLAGDGMDFLSADAMQIEYRIFAHASASPAILAAYAADPLVSFHKLVWGMVKPFVPDIDYGKVKILNFMKIYGGGRDKTAETLDLPREVSDQFVDIYDRTFPEVAPLLEKTAGLAESRGFIRTIMGRRARFPDKRFCYKAFNAYDQGSAADIMKVKIVEVHKARKATGFKMRMTVHDELCGDSPDQKCAEMVNEILNRQSFNLRVPILWKTVTGRNWAEC